MSFSPLLPRCGLKGLTRKQVRLRHMVWGVCFVVLGFILFLFSQPVTNCIIIMKLLIPTSCTQITTSTHLFLRISKTANSYKLQFIILTSLSITVLDRLVLVATVLSILHNQSATNYP